MELVTEISPVLTNQADNSSVMLGEDGCRNFSVKTK